MDFTINASTAVNHDLSDMSQSADNSSHDRSDLSQSTNSSHELSLKRNDERLLFGCPEPSQNNKLDEFAYNTAESMKKILSKWSTSSFLSLYLFIAQTRSKSNKSQRLNW